MLNLKICQTSSKLSFCFEENISMVVTLNHILATSFQNLIMGLFLIDECAIFWRALSVIKYE